MKSLIAILFLLVTSESNAQSLKQINDSLVAQYQHIFELSQDYESDTRYEDLSSSNSRLLSYLMVTVCRDPRTLSYNFSLPGGIWKATSKDGKVRIWSWDTWTGGSMAHCNSLIHFQSASGIRMQLLGDTASTGGNFCWKIYSIKRNNGETIYLPVMRGKYSNKEAAQTVLAYVISGDSLLRKKNFFVGKNRTFDSIEIDYDYFTNLLPNSREIYVKGNNLCVPLVEGEEVMKRWLKYVFNGDVFVYKGLTD